jgi:energy-coupling factor transporter ATP-binding protein EcfA2
MSGPGLVQDGADRSVGHAGKPYQSSIRPLFLMREAARLRDGRLLGRGLQSLFTHAEGEAARPRALPPGPARVPRLLAAPRARLLPRPAHDAAPAPDAGPAQARRRPRPRHRAAPGLGGDRLADLRNQFAIVLQEPVLFSTSIAENIAYVRPEASASEIAAAARAAGADDFIRALPEGYATPVGERGMKLSGGERQRVSLARLLADLGL